MRQTASGRPVMNEQLKRKDYEIATLKTELCEQRRELNELRQQLRRRNDEPSTVYTEPVHCIYMYIHPYVVLHT